MSHADADNKEVVTVSILFRYIRKNMLEKKGRLLLVILSVAISAGLLVACMGMMDTISNSFTGTAKKAMEGRELSLSAVEGVWFDETDFTSQGLTDLCGEIANIGVIVEDEKLYYVSLHGRKSFDGALKEGRWSNDSEPGIIISDRTAKDRNLKVGDTLSMNMDGVPVDFKVSAIAVTDGLLYGDTKETFSVIVSYDWMNGQMGNPDAYNVMYAKVEAKKAGKEATDTEVEDAVKKFNEQNEAVKASSRVNTLFVGDVSSLVLSVGSMLAIVVIVSVLIISGVFKMIISERLPVFGTFMSQGASKKQVSRIVLLESIFYALTAGIIGAALGEGVLYFVNRYVSPLREYGIYLPFEINWLHVILGIVFAVVISVAAAWFPIRRIGRLQTKDVILNRVEHTHRSHVIRAVIGAALLIAAVVANRLTYGEFTPVSIFNMAAAYIGVIMLAPALVKGLMSILCRVTRDNTNLWLACNNIRTSKLLISNIVLLIIALDGILACASTGVTMTKVVIEAYEELDYDYAIENIIASQTGESTADRIIAELEANPYVVKESINPQSYRAAKYKNTDILMTPVEPEAYRNWNRYMQFDSDRYRDQYDDFSNAKDDTILVTTALARTLGVKLGDKMSIEYGGIEHTWRVAAIADAKLLNGGQFVLIRRADYRNVYHDYEAEGLSFNVIGDKKTAEESFKAMITSYGATYESREEQTKANVEQNAMIVNLISIFSYLAIAISAIGIFNNIVICFNQRRKEFAVMASVGMNARKRKNLILTESMLCVVIAVLIAVPFTLLANKLISGMLYYIGIPFDILYDWKGTPMYLIAFVVIVTIASLSTMKKSKKLSVVTELKYE